jgi:hypothetical protein
LALLKFKILLADKKNFKKKNTIFSAEKDKNIYPVLSVALLGV